eukprot:s5297_g1.t1
MNSRHLGMQKVRPKTTKSSDAPWWLPPPRARQRRCPSRSTATMGPRSGVLLLKLKGAGQATKMPTQSPLKVKPRSFGFSTDIVGTEFSPTKNKLPSDKRIQRAFTTVDDRLRSFLCEGHSHNPGCNAGCTAVGAMVARNRDGTYAAKLVNCGDSRCVVIHAPEEDEMSAATIQVKLPKSLETFRLAAETNWSKDSSWLPEWPAVVETIDHKPSLWVERARIVAAGGKVCGGRRARLDGNLAVSRSLGDFDFKDNAGRRVPGNL